MGKILTNECPYINWMQCIDIYETPTNIYLVGSDLAEKHFRVLRIARDPVPLQEEIHSDVEDPVTAATIEAETIIDRMWRLRIVEDSEVLSKKEIARFLHTIQASSRHPTHSDGSSGSRTARSQTKSWLKLGGFFRKPSSTKQSPACESSQYATESCHSSGNSLTRSSTEPVAKEMQQAAALALNNGMSERSLILSTKCRGVIGVVRFLLGYYLIVINKCRLVAQIGEHKIYKIEDTSMIYIPDCDPKLDSTTTKQRSGSSNNNTATSSSRVVQDDQHTTTIAQTLESPQAFIKHYHNANVGNRSRLRTDEQRYVKLFASIDLGNNFYFSYTYDLSHCLQYNMKPVFQNPVVGGVNAVRSIPNDRYVWNWRLIPLQFRPDSHNSTFPSPTTTGHPDWFIPIFHGTISQTALTACGVPYCVTLIGRRSRHCAGTRFLKRGANLLGDVANEVETEQLVHENSRALLSHTRCSSYVQLRGSVPLFWSQEATKMVVGRPPIEFLREDPYYEAFGSHFANLFERYGSPVVVLNLMKRGEKHRFELKLSEGLERGLAYLSQFLPSRVPITSTMESTKTKEADSTAEASPPIIYVAFDIARVQKHKTMVALDHLRPVVDACIRRTGIHFYTPWPTHAMEDTANLGLRPLQCGVIRVNCVDCLDRTNTAQFVVGRVALAYQLYHLGFLSEPVIPADSKIERLMQNLYDEHGDTLALQYGGSQLVHNIDTYKKTRKLTSQSRDFLQTLSRYYANKFSDWDKQCVTNLFLRVYRPIPWHGSLFHLVCEQLLFHTSTYPIATTANPIPSSSSRCRSVGPLTHEVSAQLDIVLSTLAISIGAPFLWDASTDNHWHWLNAWAHLTADGHRSALTNWCSRSLLESLPYGTDWVGKEKRLQAKAINVPVEDVRVNWFAECYPSRYQMIDKSAQQHLRFVDLLVQPPVVGSNPFPSSDSATPDEPSMSPHTRHHSSVTRPFISAANSQLGATNPSTSRTRAMTPTKSVPDLQRRRATVCHIHQQRPGKSRLVPTQRDREIIEGTLKKVKVDSENGEQCTCDDSSSDSDSTDSITDCIKVFPPSILLPQRACFVSALERRDSDMPGPNSTIGGGGYDSLGRFRRRGVGSDVIDELTSKWMGTQSQFDGNAMRAVIKPVNRDSYQRYANLQCTNPPSRSDVSLMTSQLKNPNPEALQRYKDLVGLSCGKICPIPAVSMDIYHATIGLWME